MTGTFGTISAFSFFPSKNLGACGDGGMIVTDRVDLAQRVRSLRAHGGRKKYFHEEIGINSRLDEIQAAVLRVKLRYLEEWTACRRGIAAVYNEGFRGLDGIQLPTDEPRTRHVYHQYTIRAAHRDALQQRLADAGIGTAVYYPQPLHLQPAYEMLGGKAGDHPHAEAAASSVLSLPISPDLDPADQDRVIGAVRDFNLTLNAA